MKYDEFMGQVQSRAKLSSLEDAVKAARATLETISERLPAGEREHLASQLPDEIARFMKMDQEIDKYSIDEFFERVTEREGTRKPDAVFHARAVLDVLQDAVTKGEADDVKAQLPEEFQTLFESGSEGKLEFE